MIGDANPAKDQIAFASAATTGFRRDSGDVTPASLALDACVAAIKDAGIDAAEINGLVGANPTYIQSSLGIPHLTYWNGPGIPFVSAIANAMDAVYTGAADVVLAYHSVYRNPMFSRSAANDPFRRMGFGGGPGRRLRARQRERRGRLHRVGEPVPLRVPGVAGDVRLHRDQRPLQRRAQSRRRAP